MRQDPGVSLVLVTGICGAGKSSVCGALKSRGHCAIDADWEGFSHWVHRVTGEVQVDPSYPVPQGWLDDFAWRIDAGRVESLAAASRSGVTFLCGSAENEDEIRRHVDAVVCLLIDDATLRDRLATRTTNQFGKHPEELAAALRWNRSETRRYRDLGASLVDATQSLADVVRDVLRRGSGA
jgi:uridine kinase